MEFHVLSRGPGRLDVSVSPSFASAMRDSLPCKSHGGTLQRKVFHCSEGQRQRVLGVGTPW